jgi:hypothetical protein
LRLLRSITSSMINESKREEEGGKYYELKFLVHILDFFNYNISLAKRDHSSKIKVELLVSIFPSFRELRQSLDYYYTHKDVSNFHQE